MTKTVKTLSLFLLALLLISGCMSRQQVEQRQKNEADASLIFRSYLSDFYENGKFSNVSCILFGNGIGIDVSDCVTCIAQTDNGETFKVFTDLHDKRCYDSYRREQLSSLLSRYVTDYLSEKGCELPSSVETHVYLNSVSESIADDVDYCVDRNVDSVEELLDGDYYVYVLCKYISNKTISFETLDLSGLIPSGSDNITFSAANYRSEERFSSDDVFKRYEFTLPVYNIMESVSCSSENGTILSDYAFYPSKQIGDMEFIWDSRHNVSVSPTELQDTVSGGGNDYILTDENGVKIVCENDDSPYYVYGFHKNAEYGEHLLIVSSGASNGLTGYSYTSLTGVVKHTQDVFPFHLRVPIDGNNTFIIGKYQQQE